VMNSSDSHWVAVVLGEELSLSLVFYCRSWNCTVVGEVCSRRSCGVELVMILLCFWQESGFLSKLEMFSHFY